MGAGPMAGPWLRVLLRPLIPYRRTLPPCTAIKDNRNRISINYHSSIGNYNFQALRA